MTTDQKRDEKFMRVATEPGIRPGKLTDRSPVVARSAGGISEGK